jgi:transposase-like protein
MDTMSNKGQITTLAERVTIAERVNAGQSSREIAEALKRPLPTIRKWRQKYLREGRAGLSSQMGRPAAGALATAPAEMKDAILELREKHPGWGAQTLRLEIAKDKRFAGLNTPSRARIAAYLKEQKKVRKYEHHQDLPEPKAQQVQRPHQEWEMDAQGVTTVAGLGKVSFINLLDVFSHTSIDSHACPNTRHPKSREYQQVLRRAFIRYGLPQQISLDHDSAFYDNKSASPFPSIIHLWLIGLEVQVRFIHKRPPLEHARIERHHQTIAGQAFEGQSFDNVTALQHNLQARMLFLNREYPTRALDGQPPFQAFPQARHSSRFYCLDTEEQLLDMQRTYDYLQSGRWFRQVSSVGTFSLGGHIYNVTTRFADQTLEITFHGATRKLICLPEKETTTFQLDIQGLTKAALMGNSSVLPSFTAYQLALPLPYPDTTL